MGKRIKRCKDGRYEAKYTVRTAEGEKRRSVYGRSQKEVKEKLAKALADIRGGFVFEAGDATLEEYLNAFVADSKSRVRAKSHRRYEDLAGIHLIPALGGGKLEAPAPDHLCALYRNRLAAGYSARTVAHAHALLKQALAQAVADGLIPRNPAGFVRPPKSPHKEIRPLTPEQVQLLLTEASGDRYEALYVVAVSAGLRRGELLGLVWEDVDLEGSVLRVRRTLQKGELLPPKTAQSRRSITLTRRAVEALTRHQERQQAERAERDGSWHELDLMFPNRDSRFTDGDNLYSRHFRPLLRRAGLPPIRFHDLRHTCATLLLIKGVHPKYVQALLGHASVGLTLDLYSHWSPRWATPRARWTTPSKTRRTARGRRSIPTRDAGGRHEAVGRLPRGPRQRRGQTDGTHF